MKKYLLNDSFDKKKYTKSFNKVLLVLFCSLLTGLTLKANNLNITNVDTVNGGTDITFTISWDNSWRVDAPTPPPNNWDAVWVFIKYKPCDSVHYSHADLSTTSGDHSVAAVNPSNLTIDAVPDGKGVFIRRNSAGGQGDIAAIACTLRLAIPAGVYNFKVFGIEMVYVTQETHQVGDGGISANSFDTTEITSEGAIAVNGLRAGCPAVPAAFPKGYDSFYCMKYEITAGQYVAFLNSLSYEQQVSRSIAAPTSAIGTRAMGTSRRVVIEIKTPGFALTTPKTAAVYACDYTNNNVFDQTDDGQNIACMYLGWTDLAAYLDWAALRPMTELEYEKVCRGPVDGIDREYVWGISANIAGSITQMRSDVNTTNPGQASEVHTNIGNGSCAYGNTGGGWNDGPIRVGSTATTTGRDSSGAAYYGAMDMGGNMWEVALTACHATTNLFDGTLGDGELTAAGNNDVATWPIDNVGIRGGNFYEGATYCRTPDRTRWNTTPNRNIYYGGRGVR